MAEDGVSWSLSSCLKRAVLGGEGWFALCLCEAVVVQDDDESKPSLRGGRVETNDMFSKSEKRVEMNRVYLFIPTLRLSQKHLKLFTWNSIWVIMLMEFKLEIRATEGMKKPLFCTGCSWPWKCLILNLSFCQVMLERN